MKPMHPRTYARLLAVVWLFGVVVIVVICLARGDHEAAAALGFGGTIGGIAFYLLDQR